MSFLHLEDFTVTYRAREGQIPVLQSIDLSVDEGEAIAIIGESGSGKSTLAMAIMGHLRSGSRVRSGQAIVAGTDVFASTEKQLREFRTGTISLVPQNAGHALTPSMRIGEQIAEALPAEIRGDAARSRAEIVRLLSVVKLPTPDQLLDRYPHQLSGGQQQRVGIAMALASKPRVLVLDEPTTGLDVVTQASILHLINELRAELGMTVVLVSHDLGVVANLCERTVVLYSGVIVEDRPTRELLDAPGHPYTQALLSAIPRVDRPGLPLGLSGTPPRPAPLEDGQRPSGELDSSDMLGWERHALVADDEFREYAPVAAGETVLAVRDLEIDYRKRRDSSRGPTVEGINFDLRKGEILALIGESGSGKSSIASAIAGLTQVRSGEITLVDEGGQQHDLTPPVKKRPRKLLSAVQLVFQNADTSLNPRRTVGDAIERPLRLFKNMRGSTLTAKREEVMHDVGLNLDFATRLPGQLSGGQRQRVGIARSVASGPKVILADEIVSALDVSVQASVLRLIDDLRREHGQSVLFIGHDLAVVRGLADRVMVLHLGRVVEEGTVEDVFNGPNHPYTRALLDSILEPDVSDKKIEISSEDAAMPSAPPFEESAFADRYPSKTGNRKAWPIDFGGGHIIHTHLTREELLALPRNSGFGDQATEQD